MDGLPRLVVTPGEPAGVGPDLVIRVAQRPIAARLVVVADPELIRARAALLGLEVELLRMGVGESPPDHRAGLIPIVPVPLAEASVPGQLNPRNGEYVLETLRVAVEGCKAGHYDALVTGPVHKGVINEAGHTFTGHTEFLAELTGAEPVMMLATEGLRVALVTTHLPLAAVTQAITREVVLRKLRILAEGLQRGFGLERPRILVCGLNPHAGEGGHLGREEIEVIEPALAAARAEGIDCVGPLPADTLFTPRSLAGADAVLAMYHDQGLPVLKHLGFGRAVNVTLGLPIRRVSVDHGTALDLAGGGGCDTGSLEAALAVAMEMVAAGRGGRIKG